MSKFKKVSAVVAIALSILCILWMFLGGLVSYSNTVGASEMQNIYLNRIFSWGIASISLQLIALVLLLKSKQTKGKEK